MKTNFKIASMFGLTLLALNSNVDASSSKYEDDHGSKYEDDHGSKSDHGSKYDNDKPLVDLSKIGYGLLPPEVQLVVGAAVVGAVAVGATAVAYNKIVLSEELCTETLSRKYDSKFALTWRQCCIKFGKNIEGCKNDTNPPTGTIDNPNPNRCDLFPDLSTCNNPDPNRCDLFPDLPVCTPAITGGGNGVSEPMGILAGLTSLTMFMVARRRK